jgi:phenylacetic acid degradation protein PaaD
MDELERARQCAQTMFTNDRASQALGIEVDVPNAGASTARMRVREDMLNGFDICHGGLVFALADTAIAYACSAYNRVTVIGSGSIEFIRPALHGDELRATAQEEHRGRRSSFYTAQMRNQNDELVALYRARAISRDETVFDEN